jgi:hypothetical protein
MSSAASLRTRCPVCQKKYEVPASSAGHKARCSGCHTVFRVPVPDQPSPQATGDDSCVASHNGRSAHAAAPAKVSTSATNGPVNANGSRQPQPPTEEDIMRWLTDAEEDAELTPQPRVVRQAVASPPVPGRPVVQRIGTPLPGSSGAPLPPAPSPGDSGSAAPISAAGPPEAGASHAKPLRKTG